MSAHHNFTLHLRVCAEPNVKAMDNQVNKPPGYSNGMGASENCESNERSVDAILEEFMETGNILVPELGVIFREFPHLQPRHTSLSEKGQFFFMRHVVYPEYLAKREKEKKEQESKDNESHQTATGRAIVITETVHGPMAHVDTFYVASTGENRLNRMFGISVTTANILYIFTRMTRER